MKNQLEQGVLEIIRDELEIFNQRRSVTERKSIPDTTEIPIGNKQHWLKIPNVICIFCDLIDSTHLCADKQDAVCAKVYHLFTDTITRIFDFYDSPYIDIKGDGVFALFDSMHPYGALASAVTAKTVVEKIVSPKIKQLTNRDHGAHIGIDQNDVLVRKLGLKRYGDRTDRQNEVWAGTPVNMAAKLASMTNAGELLVSERYFRNVQNELVLKSCDCCGFQQDLWDEVSVSNNPKFDFDNAYMLKSIWCSTHGLDYIKKIKNLDKED